MPLRLQRQRTKGYRLPPNTMCVDRSSRWGNRNRVGRHGTPAQCVALYAKDMQLVEERADFLEPLRGKNLACWCDLCARHGAGKPFDVDCPDCMPCHIDVLGPMANA